MKLVARLGLVAGVAALLVGSASGAAPSSVKIVEAGGTTYPDRAYILTLPVKKSLKSSDVTVKENGAVVPGVKVGRQGTAGTEAAVVLLIDESLTMKGEPIAKALQAARAFASGASHDLAIAVVTFNGKVNVAQGFSPGTDVVSGSLSKEPDVAYGTKVYDALAQAVDLTPAQGTKSRSVILLTDGQNVGSVTTLPAALAALKKAHMRVFSVGLKSPAFDPTALQHISAATGGDYVGASSPKDLKGLFESLGRRLASEYLLTYRTHENPSERVAVSVAVKGFPKPALSAYTTPAVHIVPAAPYQPSKAHSVIQSRYTLWVVAILFALIIGTAVVIGTSTRPEPLVDRV